MLTILKRYHSTVNNLKLLNDLTSKHMKLRSFEIYSGQVELLKDPMDFYLTLYKQIKKTNRRIGISSLYLGTGSLERYLADTIKQKINEIPHIQTRLLFDYFRSERRESGDTGRNILEELAMGVAPEYKDNVRVGFLKSRKDQHRKLLENVLAEVKGVHHVKLYLFDDDVIVTGANLSHSYFTYRQDRYMLIRNAPQLTDCLYDFIDVLIDGANRIKEPGLVAPGKYDNPENYVKVWRFENKQVEKDEEESEEESVKQTKSKQNEQKQQKPKPTDIVKTQKLRKQNYRQKLGAALDQSNVAMILQKLNRLQEEQEVIPLGQKITIFPVTQLNHIKDDVDRQILPQILKANLQSGSNINICSGYMHFPYFIEEILLNSKTNVKILTASPTANSFFQGGVIKRHIPALYRSYESKLLNRSNMANNNIKIKQYIKWGWTFHTKGIWITDPSGNMLTVVGSSNYNNRSYKRDTQLQLYIYSSCQAFNERLNRQWNRLEEECEEMTVQKIEKDTETRVTWLTKILKFFNKFAKVL